MIHCNQGLSRAPSLTLLFMAKRLDELDARSYQSARSEFEELYPQYLPGRGLELFLTENWDQI